MDVSVGIMAYNEEKNIGRLLKVLLSQKVKKLKLRRLLLFQMEV